MRSLWSLEGSGFTPWGLSPQPAEMWDSRFSQTRGHRRHTRLDRHDYRGRRAGVLCLCERDMALLTLVRPMTRLTLGGILPVHPGPPSPSPETAGLLGQEAGEQLAWAAHRDLRLGPTSWRADRPLPFRAEGTHGMKYVQSLTREIGPVISQTGACPTPLPWPSCGWPVAGHTAVSGGRRAVTGFLGLPTG